MNIQSNLDSSKLMGLFFTSSNYPKCKLICTSGVKKYMARESNQNVFLIQIDASSFAEYELSVRDIKIRLNKVWTWS